MHSPVAVQTLNVISQQGRDFDSTKLGEASAKEVQ